MAAPGAAHRPPAAAEHALSIACCCRFICASTTSFGASK
jgi:hypothetical protein